MAITVTSGANARPVEGLEGKTVGEVREAFKNIYGIADDATASLNGQPTTNSARLSDGDEVSFVRRTAQKG
jgi:molybdopterin converting factor small subunit